MAEVLCVYREVELLKQSEGEQAGQAPAVAIVSYDEKPGMQAVGTTARTCRPSRTAIRASRVITNMSGADAEPARRHRSCVVVCT